MSKTCIVVSHTHWDREWYEPFQRFRLRLVRLMDKLLHILGSDPGYRYFMLDGQTIVLDDYLQIRPERRETLRRYVQQGRLLIGPWHVLPDEFLVSGEALIRNLLLGGRQAREFGLPMAVGYIPDPFGHISQMPQILRGFGIARAALRRGLDDHPTEMLWQSPDGSQVLLCYLRDGYDNAAHLPVRDEAAFAQEIVRLCKSLAPHATTEYVLLMNGTDHMEPMPELPNALQAASQLLPDFKLMHGTLPMYIDAVAKSLQLDLDRLPESAQGKLQTVKGELRSPKRHHLLPGVLSARMWIKQRNDRVQNLLEKWAEPFAALAALARDKGQALDASDAPYALIWQAWKYLLQNHPHDSICGCSIDQVHREMVTRFDWAEQIAEEITRQSLSLVADHIHTSHVLQQSTPRIPLVVFNPLAISRTDLVTASVQVPGSLDDFVIADADGRTIPHQVLSRKGAEFASLELGRDEVLGLPAMVEMVAGLGLSVQEIHVSRPEGQFDAGQAAIDVTLVAGGHTDPALIVNAQQQVESILTDATVQTFHVRAHQATTVEFQFVAEDVPGCGYKTYFLVGGQVAATSIAPATATMAEAVTTNPAATEVVTTDLHMENAFLAVDVNLQNGTLTLTDKATAAVFSGLNCFVDGGDRGDEYNYCPPEEDTLIAAPAAPPEVVWLERGPVRWTIQIKQLYRLPASLSQDRSRRSTETADVLMVSQISLSPGVPRVDIHTTIDNRASDHRLRVHFPTPVRTDCSAAEGTFDVVRRPQGVPANTDDWIEQPVPTHPQKSFVDVSDGKIGLLVANRGLPEFEVLQAPDGSTTIALTLLRCVGWLSRDDFPCRQGHAGPAVETPEAQCLGPARFEYAVVPHAGSWQRAYAQAHAFSVPLRAVSTGLHEGVLPPTQSMIHLEGQNLVLSAVKAAEAGDGLIVRFYNIAEEPTIAHLRVCIPIRSAALVNLAEEQLQDLPVDAQGTVVMQVKGQQIVTVKLKFYRL